MTQFHGKCQNSENTVTPATVRPGHNKDTVWSTGPTAPVLGEDELHVWRVALPPTSAEEHIASLHQLLSAEEEERLNKFRVGEVRNRYVTSRGMLRVLLGLYLREAPGQLHLRHDPHGKPILSQPAETLPLAFSVSHSGAWLLFAFARRSGVGVDVEQVKGERRVTEIAERFFASDEYERIIACTGAAQARAFYRLWVRKEAYAKATGERLLDALKQSVRELGLAGEESRTSKGSDEGGKAYWSQFSLSVGEDYEAAVIAQGPDIRLRCWSWDAEMY